MDRTHRNRRRALLALVGAGLALPALRLALAQDNAQGIRRARGSVMVNGSRATTGDPVRPGDRVTTGRGALAMFVVGQDAFLMRGSSNAEFEGSDLLVNVVRLVTGKLLGVYGAGGERHIETPTATVGIRGTGAYVEAQRARTYFCLCYGTADVATTDGQATESYSTTHHDSPRYIYGGDRLRRIVPASVSNHTDAELIMLEGLVGRSPPQGFMDAPQKY
ncbi:MAG TPA: iron dicitrate transport regulator FecR [Burkholderiales bacterium]|nr:iron dicitrate transport regulator FecR [Burkholderiales bacterium]